MKSVRQGKQNLDMRCACGVAFSGVSFHGIQPAQHSGHTQVILIFINSYCIHSSQREHLLPCEDVTRGALFRRSHSRDPCCSRAMAIIFKHFPPLQGWFCPRWPRSHRYHGAQVRSTPQDARRGSRRRTLRRLRCRDLRTGVLSFPRVKLPVRQSS